MDGHNTAAYQTFSSVLDVENILNLGFAFHLVQSTTSANSADARLSAKILAEFGSYDANCVTPEDRAYLFSVRTTVAAIGVMLAEIDDRRDKDLEEAERFRHDELGRINDGHIQRFLLNLATRALMYGGIGFAILGTLNPAIQAHTHQEHDGFSIGMGFVGAIVFAAGSRVVTAKMASLAEQRVSTHYTWLCAQAHRRYLHDKLTGLRHHRDRAQVLWERYSDQEAPELVSVIAITAEELRAHEGEMRERKKMTTTLLRRVADKLAAWRRKQNHHREPKHA